MAKPRKKYRPKMVKQIPTIGGWATHHSNYRYRREYTDEFFKVFNEFAQRLYDNYLTGKTDLDLVPDLPELYKIPRFSAQRNFFYKLRKDFIDGETQYEYEILEE